MAPHQGEQATQHHGFNLFTILGVDLATGELVGIGGHIGAPHDADGPVLERLTDRRNGMGTHADNVRGTSPGTAGQTCRVSMESG